MNQTCSICLSTIFSESSCITSCNHEFCYSCLNEWFDKKKASCPMCRTNIESYHHNDEKTRIILIDGTNAAPTRPRANLDMIVISRKTYKSLQVTSFCSFVLGVTNIYFFSRLDCH